MITDEGHDLVLTMTRSHLYRVVELEPSAFGRTFTLPEIARRAGAQGPNPLSNDLAAWLAGLGVGRTPESVAGDGPRADVRDPYGRPRRFHREMIDQVDGLIASTVSILAASIDPTAF